MKHTAEIQSAAKPEGVKDALATTAYRLFREQGFEQVGVRDIAAALGMTTGAVYYHFKNKSEILNYHAKKNGKWLVEESPALLEGLPPREKILRLLGEHLCAIFEKEGHELCEYRMFFKHYTRRESPYLFQLLLQLTEEFLQAEGLSARFAPEQVTRDLLLVCRGVEYDWCIHQASYPIRPKMRQMLSMVLDSLNMEGESP